MEKIHLQEELQRNAKEKLRAAAKRPADAEGTSSGDVFRTANGKTMDKSREIPWKIHEFPEFFGLRISLKLPEMFILGAFFGDETESFKQNGLKQHGMFLDSLVQKNW
jgi:hypothetical protein